MAAVMTAPIGRSAVGNRSRSDPRPRRDAPPPSDAHALQVGERVGVGETSPLIDSSTGDSVFFPLPPSRRLFRWGVLEVLERCGPERSCGACVLFEECRGRAKSSEQRGFVSIDDVTIQKQRVSRVTWEAEMLCRRPTTRDAVYAEFDPESHVIGSPDDAPVHAWAAPHDISSIEHDLIKTLNVGSPAMVTGATGAAANPHASPIILGGADFGYRSPTVVLLARFDPLTDQLLVFDELQHTQHIASRFVREFERRLRRLGLPPPHWIGADPAGHQRCEHTGESTVQVWKRAGFTMRTRRLGLETGLDAVRARLRAADGSVRLRIHARCRLLVRALQEYQYPPTPPQAASSSEAPPLKNGPDHAADALRYLVINLDRGQLGGFRCRPS